MLEGKKAEGAKKPISSISAIAKPLVVGSLQITLNQEYREGFWRGDLKAEKTRSPSPRRSRVE